MTCGILGSKTSSLSLPWRGGFPSRKGSNMELSHSCWSQTMNYVGQLAETVFGTVKELYKGLNPATLTGCIDVIVVRQPDGSLLCSPFHVRFGKLRVLRSSEKVVDIEINGEPVDLRMKLGDNGEAFFVEESEEQKESIPISLCTSPIPFEKHSDLANRASREASSLYGNPDASSSDTTLRKKRRRKRKSRRRESSADSTSEEQEGTESEMPLEEKRKLLAANNTIYYSFPDVHSFPEEAGTLQPKEAHPFSDGELPPTESLSPSCHQSAPKSDSELEIKSPEMPLGSDAHMQWSWGRLPEVSKLERSEATKPTMNMATTATLAPTSLPVGETTHFVAISECHLDTADSVDASDCPVAPLIRPTPVFSTGNDLPRSGDPSFSAQVMASDQETTVTFSTDAESHSKPAESEGKKSVEMIQELEHEAPSLRKSSLDQEALSLGKTNLEQPELSSSSEPQQEMRRGSVKRSSHLGPTDIYLEDLSNLDAEQVALYFPKRDAEPSGQAQTDPSNFSQTHLQGGTDNLESMACNVMPHILLSVCGGLGDSGDLSHEEFMKHVVSYQEFAENPAVIEDPNLVVQIHNKYYNWSVAAPMILSLQAFQKNLPRSTVDRLMKEKMPKKGGRWWFSWRRRELSNEEPESNARQMSSTGSFQQRYREREDTSSSDEETTSSGRGARPMSDSITQKFLPTYKKSLRLSSDQIKSLNLRDGPNEAAFSVTTQYQGTCRCEATIYLWNWDDKVVISDIDGTITRSDALGHILPHLGKDWTHQGIAKLYHKIHLNGYKFLYCSARTIGLAHITKGYLDCVKDEGCVLPKGPILLAPSSLFSAFHRDVIEGRPEVFKIACLKDIQNLFGSNRQPFHAAFGNRTNDVQAYKKVNLPESRIFTVNPRGELIQELVKIHKSTYERLSDIVDFIFPPIGKDVSFSMECPEYSHFPYWRAGLPAVDLEDHN
ncbi:phosphatidate phosphatase LPIN3 isoform X2 [Sphaerodactylus townsendi]|uniref:phosphatidate phosphatase LPIN3 isoform X2 n=1 Tax=Sphaerodactylus townsendi TaxID=933632 RepID=UPI002026FA62|nr:phosphatidate phosphatase LPIN3 isoform X2 [Sphaerodactylus townsendi]